MEREREGEGDRVGSNDDLARGFSSAPTTFIVCNFRLFRPLQIELKFSRCVFPQLFPVGLTNFLPT